MNKILINKKYKDIYNLLYLAHNAMTNNDYSLPLSLYPNEVFHCNPKDAWDEWENKKYIEHYPESVTTWNRIQSLSKRIQKIESKRLKNVTYCNKSNKNLSKLSH